MWVSSSNDQTKMITPIPRGISITQFDQFKLPTMIANTKVKTRKAIPIILDLVDIVEIV